MLVNQYDMVRLQGGELRIQRLRPCRNIIVLHGQFSVSLAFQCQFRFQRFRPRRNTIVLHGQFSASLAFQCQFRIQRFRPCRDRLVFFHQLPVHTLQLVHLDIEPAGPPRYFTMMGVKILGFGKQDRWA